MPGVGVGLAGGIWFNKAGPGFGNSVLSLIEKSALGGPKSQLAHLYEIEFS